MNITFFSDYPNGTQIPLCTALSTHPNVDSLTFVSLSGQGSAYKDLPYSVLDGTTHDGHERALHLAETCDVAIYGSLCGHEEFLEERMSKDGLAFRITERLLAKGTMFRHIPPLSQRIENRFLRYGENSLYALCIGTYTAPDLQLCGFPREKCLDWAYLPKTVMGVPDSSYPRDTVELLWVARQDESKPPQVLLDAFSRVASSCETAMLHLVLWPRANAYQGNVHGIEDKDTCVVHNLKRLEEAQYLMASADILVSTSGKGDGWDFGILPSLSAGCTVVARREGDTAGQFIEDGCNGVFWDGTAQDLASKLLQLCQDEGLRHRIGGEARRSAAAWDAETSADRLVVTAKALLEGNALPFEEGPCSMRTSTVCEDAGEGR